MRIRLTVRPGELPARSDDLRRCVEHVIAQHSHAPGCGCGCEARGELQKALKAPPGEAKHADQRPKPLDHLVLETSVSRARRQVNRAQRAMLRKINRVLAEVV